MTDKEHSILIVDDEADIRQTIIDVLEMSDLPVKIFQATDGLDGLNKIEKQKFDLVIADLNMPKMSGKELIQKAKTVHKDYRPTQYLVISASVENEILKESGSGISILKKPFSADELLRYTTVILTPKKKKSSAQPKKKANRLDVDFINPFINATLEVLDIMAQVKAEKDFIFVKEDSDALGDITGIIPINSEKVYGSMSISFTDTVFLKVMSNMLGEEMTEINDENEDGVAELCNQIFGNAKAALNGLGHHLDMTIPTVISGPGHKVKHAANGSIIGVYFNTEFGTFVIECIAIPK